MPWEVEFEDAFEAEFLTFEQEVQDALLAVAKLLADYGPQLGRPHADSLKGSKYANMKELRFEAAAGEWRATFAFNFRRKAILLVAGNKSGGSQRRSYRQLVSKADQRFSTHLQKLKDMRKGNR